MVRAWQDRLDIFKNHLFKITSTYKIKYHSFIEFKEHQNKNFNSYTDLVVVILIPINIT